ncbi:MAG TPA: hypothetical protein VHB30_12615, partial [Solirubrobacteraceae bacterium]|nr:hypothetical protein [Solirubrobacteraceae bacterium]
MRLRIRERVVGLRAPFAAAHGTIERRTLLEVELEGADGVVGRGEAAPLPSYDGVEVGDVAELRLVGVAGEVRFGRTFIYHPKSARAAIVERTRALL